MRVKLGAGKASTKAGSRVIREIEKLESSGEI